MRYMLIVRSTPEAEEAAKDGFAVGAECPLGPGVKLEVRRVQTIDEFDQDNEYIQKEKEFATSADFDLAAGAGRTAPCGRPASLVRGGSSR